MQNFVPVVLSSRESKAPFNIVTVSVTATAPAAEWVADERDYLAWSAWAARRLAVEQLARSGAVVSVLGLAPPAYIFNAMAHPLGGAVEPLLSRQPFGLRACSLLLAHMCHARACARRSGCVSCLLCGGVSFVWVQIRGRFFEHSWNWHQHKRQHRRARLRESLFTDLPGDLRASVLFVTHSRSGRKLIIT